jgi:ferredoxin-NADP reductase
MTLTLQKTKAETPHITTFYFTSDAPIAYTAGQYMHWFLPHENADDRHEDRWFTISSSPTEREIHLTTKFSEPSSTFKQHLRELKPGDTLKVDEVYGDFTLPEDADESLVFIAGGIGVTPFRSMLKFAHDKGIKQPIQLLYSARTGADFAFAEEFKAFAETNANLKITYLPEDTEGRLSPDKIKDLTGGLESKTVYISGPAPMVKGIEADLIAAGVADDQIKIDDFPGYEGI